MKSTFVFLLTATIVILLAFSIYSSNHFLNYLMVRQGIENNVNSLAETISAKDAAGDLQTLLKAREFSSETQGMRLSSGSSKPKIPEADLGENSVAAISARKRLYSILSSALKPSRILAMVPASTKDLRKPSGTPLGELAQTSQLDPSELQATFAQLQTGTGPVTHFTFSWLTGFSPRAYIVVPHFHVGKLDGALVLLMDHQPRIANNALITRTATLIVGGLSLISFLFAGFLLWARFRDQVKTNRHMEYMAHHDALTGLPNRAVFNAQLTEALRMSHAKATNMGVMLIDVDKFKEINDTHGHAAGDIFLQIVASRLRQVFGDHLVARLSGDEFAVMIKSVSDVARLTRLAADLIQATQPACNVDGIEIKMSLSVGIARATDGSWRSSRVLHCADLALYRAKHTGRSTFAWYTPDMDAEAQKRKEIEDGLEKALKLDQFEILYQPQYSLKDNKLKGFESLIRWEHPTKGTISPEVFIPVAEDCGLIADIGDWVLFHSCREAARWKDKSLRVAVNVSAAQFKPEVTEHKVAQALKESGLAPERLEIEITESLLIANTEAVVETLRNIRAMGVSVAMDDFGTGYSSLSYLSRFPFDKIKIDRAFINNLGQDDSTDAIVTSIIGLGRSLDIQITAEGVENIEQVTLLRAAGCHLVQGYLFGRPGQASDAPSIHLDKSYRNKSLGHRKPLLTAPPEAAASTDIADSSNAPRDDAPAQEVKSSDPSGQVAPEPPRTGDAQSELPEPSDAGQGRASNTV